MSNQIRKIPLVTSVSGGKTSAYVAANYPSDHNIFALVRTEDQKCKFPDKKLRQYVEDRLQAPFVGTLEDDMIIYTMLDLEQFLGRPIQWVTGITFDQVIREKGGWLPNKLHRYCTTFMKIEPIFQWVYHNLGLPVKMQIGYRANEMKRAKKMIKKLNSDGLLEYKATVSKVAFGTNKGKNHWEEYAWQEPSFVLIGDRIYRDTINNYWENKEVRFAELNNCAGCFHRDPLLLHKQFELQPPKMDWFKCQEGGKNGYWRADVSYASIQAANLQFELELKDFSPCDSGYCGI